MTALHHYWIKSPDSSSTMAKPVMVFLHGWGGSSHYWQTTAAELSDQFDCLLIDLRGFGQSNHLTHPMTVSETEQTILNYVDDVRRCLDLYDLDPVWLQAHSFGATLAAYLMADSPERIQAGIIACNGVFPYNAIAFNIFQVISTWIVQLRGPWIHQFSIAPDLFMSRFLYQSIDPTLKRQFLDDFIKTDKNAAIATVRAAVSEQATRMLPEKMREIQCPTLLITGEKDQILPPQGGINAVQLNPHITYQEIAQSGHFPMLEMPEVYLKAARQFITSCQRQSQAEN